MLLYMNGRFGSIGPGRWITSLALGLSTAVGACASGSPPLVEWESMWTEAVNQIHASIDAAPLSHADCETTLGMLRETRPNMDPPPLSDLRQPVSSWFDTAESAFFTCEIDGQVTTSLRALEAETATVLKLER